MRIWGLDQGWKGLQVAKLIGSRGEEHLVHGDALVALQVDTTLVPLHASIIKHQLFGENPLPFSK